MNMLLEAVGNAVVVAGQRETGPLRLGSGRSLQAFSTASTHEALFRQKDLSLASLLFPI